MKFTIGIAAFFLNLFVWWFLDRMILGNPPLKFRQEFPIMFGSIMNVGIFIWATS